VARREDCGKEGGVWQGVWQGGRIVARREEMRRPPFLYRCEMSLIPHKGCSLSMLQHACVRGCVFLRGCGCGCVCLCVGVGASANVGAGAGLDVCVDVCARVSVCKLYLFSRYGIRFNLLLLQSATTMPFNSHAFQQPCLSTAMPFNSHAFQQPCLSAAMPFNNHAFQQPCLSTTMPFNNHAFQQPCLSATMPFNNHAFQQPCLSATMPNEHAPHPF